ncbi:hypothetical protein FKP32DRAFT_251712 [Trametes sanguinea]|nr:hypothetical protein FKP32DRAFT_251712 [Trametes sanguinea]
MGRRHWPLVESTQSRRSRLVKGRVQFRDRGGSAAARRHTTPSRRRSQNDILLSFPTLRGSQIDTGVGQKQTSPTSQNCRLSDDCRPRELLSGRSCSKSLFRLANASSRIADGPASPRSCTRCGVDRSHRDGGHSGLKWCASERPRAARANSKPSFDDLRGLAMFSSRQRLPSLRVCGDH